MFVCLIKFDNLFSLLIRYYKIYFNKMIILKNIKMLFKNKKKSKCYRKTNYPCALNLKYTKIYF